MSRHDQVLLQSLLALGCVLLVSNSASAASVYAAYTTSPGAPFADGYGIAEFNSQTLQPINFFSTTGPTSGLTYLNGSIFDIEGGKLYQRNAMTGAIIHSTPPPGTSIFRSTALHGEDIYVTQVINGAQFLIRNGTGEFRPLLDVNNVLGNTVADDGGYSTGAAGKFYTETGGRLVVSDLDPSTQYFAAIVGTTSAVHLGQFTYNRDISAMQAAATVNIAGVGNVTGIFNYNASTGNVIAGLIGPAGILLSYEPNGVAYGFNGLYATNQSTIRRYGASDGSSQGSFAFTPFGISTTLGQLLFVQLTGDINLDGRITASDIPALLGALTDLNAYESTNHLSNTDLLQIADLNGDGKVTNADIQSLLNLVASGAGSVAAVPEPSTLLLFALGGVLCFRSQKRCGAG